MAKILFISKQNSENFIRNYTRYADQFAPGSELFMPSNELPVPTQIAQVRTKAKDFDTLIFEWGNDLTGLCLNESYEQQVIVRVHDHEVRKGRITADYWKHGQNWRNVDRVWFINREVQEMFEKVIPGKDTFFLPNAVDPAPFTENRVDNKQMALLTISARKRKRIDRAIELAKMLPDWTLTIRTENYTPPEDGVKDEYFQKVLLPMAHDVKNVVWDLRWFDPLEKDGYPQADVNAFFQDKAVVLSTSEHEGFHYTIAEGALCGAMPVVFNWESGNPLQFWKPFTCHSLKTMAAMIEGYKPSPEYRKYVVDNFSPANLWPRLLAEIKKPIPA